MKMPSVLLFNELTKNFPAPWTLEYHKDYPSCASRVVAANGKCPITLETHSGDGDRFNLGTQGAKALAQFVNSMARILVREPLKTIAEWNADKAAACRLKSFDAVFSFPKPEPIGAVCECGGELMTKPGWLCGCGPYHNVIECAKCKRRGYIDDWNKAETIVML